MHWMSNLWFNYFWASLKGNGPEALVQTVAYGLLALIVIPPVRHWVSDHVKGIHDKLASQHEEHLRVLEQNHRKQMDLIAKNHKVVMEHVAPKATPKPPAARRRQPREGSAN